MVSVDILFQIKSTQLNDIKFMWKKLKEWLLSSEMELPIDAIPLREEKRTETTAEREGITVRIELWHSNYLADGDTTISMCMFRWASFHIQYTFNSSHKINLLSLQFKIK